MIQLQVEMPVLDGARLIAPTGFGTPHASPTGVTFGGADAALAADPVSAQQVLVLMPTAKTIRIDWTFQTGGASYPQAMFERRDSRFTRVASELVEEATGIALAAGGGIAALSALANHVAGLFSYGHPKHRFYDGMNEIPQLCSITEGSCIDINAYFIAAVRGAGYDAGYVTGYFIPDEKRTHCEDMHCWVVTRHDDITLEWDIAHHLKMGLRDISPGLNPKPGVRVPMAHSMGLTFPSLKVRDLKLISEPMWLCAGGTWQRADLSITLTGYEELATAGNE